VSAARGGFDRNGNAWFGGRSGSIVELDTRQRKVREYWPPIATAEFYEAMPDKNGEVWVVLQPNPRTDQWIEYGMPEPYAHDLKNLDRQFHRSDFCLVRGLPRYHRAHTAPG
jgi:hypothetical protein